MFLVRLKAGWVHPEETPSKKEYVIKAVPSYTCLKHIVLGKALDREEGRILRGSLTNWLLDPSLMRCLSFASPALFFSSLRVR